MMNDLPMRPTTKWSAWMRYLAGPLAGLLTAAAVLTMSYTVGQLSGGDFALGLVAVGTASVIALTVGSMLLRQYLGYLLRAELSHEGGPLPTTLSRLEMSVDRVERTVRDRFDQLADLDDVDDSQLCSIETHPDTYEIVICRREMGDEFEHDPDAPSMFEVAVGENIQRQVRYRWITEDNPISRRRESVVRGHYAESADLITVVRCDSETWQRIPILFEVVFILQNRSNGTTTTLAYADTTFGRSQERVWRQVEARQCVEWLDRIETVVG